MNERIKFCLQILLVIAIGLLAVNQAYVYWGHTASIRDPCGSCEKNNPGTTCTQDTFQYANSNINYVRMNLTNFSSPTN